MIDEDLDEALDREALVEGVSKASLIRRFVRERLKPLAPLRQDPLWELVGADEDAEPVDDIDAFLYGASESP